MLTLKIVLDLTFFVIVIVVVVVVNACKHFFFTLKLFVRPMLTSWTIEVVFQVGGHSPSEFCFGHYLILGGIIFNKNYSSTFRFVCCSFTMQFVLPTYIASRPEVLEMNFYTSSFRCRRWPHLVSNSVLFLFLFVFFILYLFVFDCLSFSFCFCVCLPHSLRFGSSVCVRLFVPAPFSVYFVWF